MAFFDSTTILEGAGAYATVDLADLLEDASVPELGLRSSLVEDAYMLIAESEENWNNIMKACGYNELKNFAETAQPYVFTEASGNGFIASAKAFFAKIWQKIQSLFKKFLVMIGSFVQSDKSFVESNKATIGAAMSNIPSDAKFKGYKYTGLGKWTELVNTTKSEYSMLTAQASGEASDSEKLKSSMRGKLAGGGDLSEAEMRKKLYETFRGSEEKEDLTFDHTLVTNAMKTLLSAAEVKTEANKAYKALSDYFNKIDGELNKLSKSITANYKADGENAKTASDALVSTNRAITANKDLAGMFQTGNSIFLSCLKDYSRQCKAICVKVVTFKTPKHEAATFSHYGEGANFLESVVLK